MMTCDQTYDDALRLYNYDIYEWFPWKYGRPLVRELNPWKLYQKLDQYQSHFTEVKGLMRQFGARVEYIRSAVPFTGICMVGGDTNPDIGRIDIRLSVRYNDDMIRRMRNRKWSWVKFKVIQTLLHETVHRMQYVNNGGWVDDRQFAHSNKDGESEYLSNRGEVEAWAHCSFMEFCAYKAQHPDATMTDYVKLFTSDLVPVMTRFSRAEALFLYSQNFSATDPAYKRFLEQMRKWVRLNKIANKELALA